MGTAWAGFTVMLVALLAHSACCDIQQDQEDSFSISVNGDISHITVNVNMPPYSTAKKVCSELNLLNNPGHHCETSISSKIHQLQWERMAKYGSGGVGVHRGDYFVKSNWLEQRLQLQQMQITEGHMGLSPQKVDYLSRLSASPLIRNIVQVGMNAGHSALLFLESNPNSKVYSIDSLVHDYIQPASDIIENWHPKRHHLLTGSSHTILQDKDEPLSPKDFLPWNATDLFVLDGDVSFDSVHHDIKNGCSLLAAPCEQHRDLLILINNVGPGCSHVPVNGLFSANSCDATKAWRTAVEEGVAVEVDTLDAVEFGRVSSFVLGKCLCT